MTDEAHPTTGPRVIRTEAGGSSALPGAEHSVCYEFRVGGVLGDTLLGAFPDLRAEVRAGETVLAGALPDQAALHGVLVQIEQLGLELLDVHRTPC